MGNIMKTLVFPRNNVSFLETETERGEGNDAIVILVCH